MLDMPFDGPRKHEAFHVAPHIHKIGRRHGVIDSRHLLLDDRPLVEDGRHVMGGRPDQLHAARVRLVIRLRALEARQERVMNVDGAPRQRLHRSSDSTCM